MRPPLIQVLGTVVASIILYQTWGLSAVNHSTALSISSSGSPAEIPAMRVARNEGSWIAGSFRRPFLKSAIWRFMYSTGRPASVADSGCPIPDIRWQDPQAWAWAPFATILGKGPCSSGNQSGGLN